MIRFDHVTFTYPDTSRPALADVDVTIPEGELWLVIGRTGAGKSTLLRSINGLVPHFSGGTLRGQVLVDGRSTATAPPRELADLVGVVGQDPTSGFVADTVEDELAYAMENLGVAHNVMRRRVEDALDLLSIADLRHRALGTLSSGQAQRVAIASVLTAAPRVLVLDEPTSALDPGAAEEVLAALTRLVHDLGLTIVAAEHRLERVVQYADRVIAIDEDGAVRAGDPRSIMTDAPVAPPVVELGVLAGWRPLPLSVRDARRAAGALRERLARTTPPAPTHIQPVANRAVVTTHRLSARYGNNVVLRDITLQLDAGEIVALMGRNGAGKSTLLNHLGGLLRPAAGELTVNDLRPYTLNPQQLVRNVGLVPPDPSALLYEQTVHAEAVTADREHHLEPGTTLATVDALGIDLDPDRHPRDLSEGQRLALAIGVVVAPAPDLVLLDEPTRGLDYDAKRHLTVVLRALAARGHAIMLATHDVELVAAVATRAIVLADGDIVSDGPARDVVCHSPVFAPQTAKILAPGQWLTVAEVEAALIA